MGMDIATYRARIGLFGRRKSSVTLNCESVSKEGITKLWLLGLIIASLPIVNRVEKIVTQYLNQEVHFICTLKSHIYHPAPTYDISVNSNDI